MVTLKKRPVSLRVVFVHGWNVSDAGKRSIDQLAPHFVNRGHEVDTDGSDYGHITWQYFLAVFRWAIWPTIKPRLIKAFENADVILTHSNGANFAHRALKEMERRTDGKRVVIHFSPAIRRKTPLPTGADEVHVIHNRGDWVVRAASVNPFWRWGKAGAVGLKDPDGITRFNHDGREYVKGHSAYFRTPEQVAYWSDYAEHLAYQRATA